MSVFPEFHQYDGLGLAELVRTRQVTPGELVEEAISRIEAHNPVVNAVVRTMYEQARAAAHAGLPDGPFRGVPFLLKDLLSMCAGVPTGSGNRLLQHVPMPHDSEMVRRFRKAGVIILGKTNTPEFGVPPTTEPEVLGATRNPWDPTRTPGGSSGGAAAAVAARMVPIASGGDGGGSIRIPASCCGLFGLKVTRGRTPTGPDWGEVWRGFASEHVITRSVRDSAAMLDATSGPEVGAPYASPAPPPRPFLEQAGTEPGRLRVAFTTRPLFGAATVHDDCRTGLQAAVRLLQELGHEVSEAAPAVDAETCALAFVTIIVGEARVDIEWTARLADRTPSVTGFEAVTYGLGLLGQATSAADYARASRLLQLTGRAVGRFFEAYDVLLTPTLARPPVALGTLMPSPAENALLRMAGRLHAGRLLRALGVIRTLAARTFDFIPYTPLFNVTGQPAMSVPLHWNAEGLPIGMHFAARFGDEATLLRLAGQLERARPWFDRGPPGF